ncbi:MAG: hypothetical protein H0V82_00135 [Candidatus Protochlamydia sp.]|nr:hypothetical protein [Candidatus Protochlamydia sp.]
MHNLALIEEYYKKFIKELPYIPEGVFVLNLDLLNHFDLLHFQPSPKPKEGVPTRYFHIIESLEKITLLNEEFLVWIIPDRVDRAPITYILIALNQMEQEPRLEAAFVASGIYNSSKLVLKVLEKFLMEIHENEKLIAKFKSI